MSKPPGGRVATSSIRKAVSTIATAGLLASALVVGTAAAASAAPIVPGGVGQTSFEPGRYIVTLAEDAVATYEGGTSGYEATTPDEGDQLNARRAPVQSYSDYLETKQQDVAAAVGATIDYSYTMALNGFAADLTAAQAAELASNKDVVALTPDELKHITAVQNPVPSTEFLGLEGDGGVWAATGGAETAGAGVVVGVLDTGIAPENPAFAGDPLTTVAGDEPYLSAENTITYTKGDGDTFTGTCQTGEQFVVGDCSTKIVGARYFVNGFGEANLGDATTGTGEFVSPRDGDGHGSHTGSTAVGNYGTEADVLGRDFGTISGVAPAAKIAAYKVCWSGPDDGATTDDGCTTTDMLAAINQAVRDGVDVLNFSIGGGAAETTFSPTDEAFLGAAAAGIFVAASAGNSGPGSSTLDNASPWITTVAASTIPSYYGTVTLGDGQSFVGASITVTDPVAGGLVNSTAVAAAGDAGADAALCAPGSLDPALVPADTLIVCDRGVVDRTAKSAEVARVGGIGMVLINPTPSSIDPDAHTIPTVHVDARFRTPIVEYAATPGATVTLSAGNSTDYTPPTPALAGFSSRGPVLADGSDILKPDITAPGVAILAAGPNQAEGTPTFEFLSGTSMSSPHIAGLAALYLGERPTATPAEIKSAMMTSAYNTVDADGVEITDPFAQGAGHVDPTKFFDPGLLYLNGPTDWLGYLQGIGYDAGVEPIDGSNLNLASIAIGTLTAPETITRTVTSTQAGVFTASVAGLDGITATVEPTTLEFAAAGETKSYTVTLARTDAPLDQFTTGSLTWTSGETTVRSPIAVQPATIVAPAEVDGTGVTGSVDVSVTPGGDGDIPLTTSGLSLGTLLPDATGDAPGHSGSGVKGDEVTYDVTVPEGAEFARFDLDSIDDTADLDLIVYQLDAAGTPVAGWQSATGAADERVDLVAPEAGAYQMIVSVFAANPSTAWDATATSVLPGGSPLTLTPAVIAGQQGVATTYTASWADLEPQSRYLGLVNYGDTGAVTAVAVTTGEAPEPTAPVNVTPPTITGTPAPGSTLTASPGEWDTEGLAFTYQWQSNGADIAGATAATYKVAKADQGAVITVAVTATAEGLDPTTAVSAGVTVAYTSTTKLSVNRFLAFSWQQLSATVTVKSGSPAPAEGTVTVTVNGKPADVALTAANNGTLTYTLPKLGAGVYVVKASYGGSPTVLGSQSSSSLVWVIF
ncbi:subtilisin family serine protease [Conyzicola lurida]|uniref:Subtilisin family serine protease n=1 Tax=Conyzicola lurida TaxID=1172621 RepID=A0A841AKC7_9MICO|nr:S8 family serine peptidase [Conyzicola lurida]MBB5841925.1 subtilisin family serine protease [Conyzicola lurida]